MPLSHLYRNVVMDLLSGAVPAVVSAIRNNRDLDQHLPAMCNTIFTALTARQLESTYQRCLKKDLQLAGVSVHEEVVMFLEYKVYHTKLGLGAMT
jgi:hypothetical protein